MLFLFLKAFPPCTAGPGDLDLPRIQPKPRNERMHIATGHGLNPVQRAHNYVGQPARVFDPNQVIGAVHPCAHVPMHATSHGQQSALFTIVPAEPP